MKLKIDNGSFKNKPIFILRLISRRKLVKRSLLKANLDYVVGRILLKKLIRYKN